MPSEPTSVAHQHAKCIPGAGTAFMSRSGPLLQTLTGAAALVRPWGLLLQHKERLRACAATRDVHPQRCACTLRGHVTCRCYRH